MWLWFSFVLPPSVPPSLPVLKKHNFFDSGLLYQFSINFRRRRRLSELLHDNEQDNEEGPSVSTLEDIQPDSSFVLDKIPHQEEYTGFHSGKIKYFAYWRNTWNKYLRVKYDSIVVLIITQVMMGKR